MIMRIRTQGQRVSKLERPAIEHRFIATFAETANIRLACEAAGISRTTLYGWLNDPGDFRAQVETALADADDRVREEIRRRAIDGVQEPVTSAGKVVYTKEGTPVTVTKYSDTLLKFLASARMPEFKDRITVTTTNQPATIDYAALLANPVAVEHAIELAKALGRTPAADS